MLEIQGKFIPSAPGLNFSRTPPESGFLVSCVGSFRYSPVATGRFVPEHLPGLKTNTGLNTPGELTVERFNIRIVGWFSQSTEIQGHFIEVSPPVQTLRNELRAVFHSD